MPQDIRRYISVSQDAYTNSPIEVRQFLYETALNKHLEHLAISYVEPTRQESLEFVHWSWSGNYVTRQYRGYHLTEFIYKGNGYNHPVIIDAENVSALLTTLSSLIRQHLPFDTWYCYQVVLITTNQWHITGKPGNIIGSIINRMEKYDENSMMIYELSLRYISPEIQRETLRSTITNVAAGHGEGISIPLERGYWLLDIARSKSLCIVNCYIAWLFYRDHRLIDLFTTDALSRTKKYLKLPVLNRNWSIYDVIQR
ncbi:hypothetical protein G6F27_013221 [Rhizopus arrhizus]|nr:hypothetical protein G6F27_013221 [Rhizopus arrhizus]